MKFRMIPILLILTVAFFLSGCGGTSDVPETGEVTGTIKMDGKPVPKANVSFQPEEGRPSYGITDDGGRYELTYNESVKGAKIGKNLVTISSGSDEGGEYRDDSEQSDAEAHKDPSIPAKFNTEAAKNPDMTVEVKAGANTFNFDLKLDE